MKEHEGEVWRKRGPFDWCRINWDETSSGGVPGFAVSFGKWSFKQKRVYWCLTGYFYLAHNYEAFVAQMKVEQRYLMRGLMKEQKNDL